MPGFSRSTHYSGNLIAKTPIRGLWIRPFRRMEAHEASEITELPRGSVTPHGCRCQTSAPSVKPTCKPPIAGNFDSIVIVATAECHNCDPNLQSLVAK